MLSGVVFLAACRQDMHDQPKYIPLRSSDFFRDGRSARVPVEGTVARGHLRDDEHFYTGKRNGVLVETLPFPATRAGLERGRERYNIYCAPCHSRVGDGSGVIVQRGYRRPESFHAERLRNAPVGHYFDAMTRGFGAMPDLASQISPQDRWVIAAYIRALQLSQHATLADVPESERGSMGAAPAAPAGGEKK